MQYDHPIRPVGPEDFDALYRVIEHAFAAPRDPEEQLAAERELLEFDRTLGVFDGEEIVGSGTIYSLEMTLPGGRTVPTAGVSWIAVLPTHRRRGILRALMRRQLDDIHDAGREPVAALWASESSIYGRFGYGLASRSLSLTVPRAQSRLRDVPGADGLRVRLVDAEASLDRVQPVYDTEAHRRPGMLHPPTDAWRRARILDPEGRRDGASALRTLLIEDEAGGLHAYARYTTRPSWGRGGPAGTVHVRELQSTGPAGAAAAWRYLLDLDLVATLSARGRPVDDPLLHLLVDPRAAQPELGDALYVRIVDLPAAMRAREYAIPVDVVLEVDDEICPWNAGRWQLRSCDGEVRCERSEQEADLHLDVRDLAACYLGGTSLRALTDAGLVAERTAGAVTALGQALHHEPAPWCPFVF